MIYAPLKNPVRVLVCDAPWEFSDPLPGETRGAAKQYDVMGVRDIIRFPLPPIADNAILFFWRVASQQEEALRVIDAWGYRVKSEIVWIKRTSGAPEAKLAFGMGHYTRGAHETCLVATRGKFHVSNKAIRSIFETIELDAPLGAHSAKPDSFYALVERLCFDEEKGFDLENGPVELFGRTPRPGWHVFGNEVGPEKLPYVGMPHGAGPVAVLTGEVKSTKQTVTVTGGNVQIGDENSQTIAEATKLPDSVAVELGEHPALVDDVTKERIIYDALNTDLVTAEEVRKGTEYVWPLILKRAADKGVSLRSISGSNGQIDKVVAVENISALCGALCARFLAKAFTIPQVATWPQESRDQARKFLAGKMPPPPEVQAYMDTLYKETPIAAPPEPLAPIPSTIPAPADDGDAAFAAEMAAGNPAKNVKRGRPKKQKPCPGCNTLTDGGALCEACKHMLAHRDANGGQPAAEAAFQKTMDAVQAQKTNGYDPFAPPEPVSIIEEEDAWTKCARLAAEALT